MNRFYNTLAMAASAIALSSTAMAEELAMQKYGNGYKAPGNVKMELAFTADNNAALMKVTGVNHAWDGTVKRLEIEDLGPKGQNFYIDRNGKQYVVITNRSGGWGGSSMQLHLPDYNSNPLNLRQDDKIAATVKPIQLRTMYQQTQ